MNFFIATLETRNFEFKAYGQTKELALQALQAGFSRHASSYRLNENWYLEFEGDIEYQEAAFGQCFRDKEQISWISNDEHGLALDHDAHIKSWTGKEANVMITENNHPKSKFIA